MEPGQSKIEIRNGGKACICNRALFSLGGEDITFIEIEEDDELFEHLARYLLHRSLPADTPMLKQLYVLSAKLRIISLRDDIEQALLPVFSAGASPVDAVPEFRSSVGLTTDFYRTGAWRQLYAREFDKDTIARSLHECPPIPSALFAARQMLSSSTALPDPFGLARRGIEDK